MLDVVAYHEQHGRTPDEVVTHFPSLTLADVHAALSYYFDHIDEIREEMRSERVFAEQVQQSIAPHRWANYSVDFGRDGDSLLFFAPGF